MLIYLVLLYMFWGPPRTQVAIPVWAQQIAERISGEVSERTATTGPCGIDLLARGGLPDSSSPQLRKLAEYETVCKGRFADTHMLFSPTPATVDEGARLGKSMAQTLREFDRYSVRPLVIMEPATSSGELLPMVDFGGGTYDASLISYFQSLKDNGVNDAMMGMWVPFPEANTPVWGSTDPQAYTQAVNKVASLQKQRFPESKTSLLLASQSYPTGDVTWQRGAYKSLEPYVVDIRQGLVDSLGYQGFPWAPPATEPAGTPVVEPKQFLRTDLATEAAETLEVRDIWFNTGTFGRAHADNADEMVVAKPAERKELLKGIVNQAVAAEDEGYRVAINLFAEDKSAGKEGIDWSYWRPGEPADSSATPVFQGFVKDALANNIDVWLYDDDHQGTTEKP